MTTGCKSILIAFAFTSISSCVTVPNAPTLQPQPLHFSVTQQEFFVKNLKYYIYFSTLLRSKMQPDEIAKQYGLRPESTHKYLGALQEIGLIKVDKNNKVTIVPSGDYETWNPDEPMGKAYNTGFIATLMAQALTPPSQGEHADALIGVLTLSEDQKQNFMSDFLALKQKYRALSNEWSACKGNCPQDKSVRGFATVLVVGEDSFNKIFYPQIDNDI